MLRPGTKYQQAEFGFGDASGLSSYMQIALNMGEEGGWQIDKIRAQAL